MAKGTCSIEACERPATKRGWCERHYRRWCRYGDPLAGRVAPLSGSIEERFWPRVDKNGPNGCWLWTIGRDAYGYGQIARGGGGMVKVHRLAYELLVGPIPPGLTIDHLCRNRACVNPAHMEPVTNAENLRRGARHRKAEKQGSIT